MQTVVRLTNKGGSILGEIRMDYDDADTTSIARAAISIIERGMSMSEGDTITVTEEEKVR